MIFYFIVPLFITFLIIRSLAYRFHDMKNYGTEKERSKTITGWIRVKTRFDWHHFHFGIIILLVTFVYIFLFNITKANLIFLAIGTSMIIDQAVPIIYRKSNYFHVKNLLISFIFHIIIAILSVIVFYKLL